jgi:AraC-like DNA-binding protein
MQYYEFPLRSPLVDHVQTIWALESEKDEDAYPRSVILPDGIVELVLHYETPFYTYKGTSRFRQPEHFAISMMRECIEIESAGKTGFISVRFFPWGAYHFFDTPVRDFLDQTLDATTLWGSDAQGIIKELKRCGSIEEKFKRVEQFLLEKLTRSRKQEDKTGEAIRLIRETKGELTIEEICAKTGFSKKQLERKFMATVGILPKGFSRITRFLNICQNLQEHKTKTLTQLSLECGFYDQAHFIKEFKAFSGFTPGEFFEKEHVYFSEI